jgi:sarcosine oxidase subunit gamma
MAIDALERRTPLGPLAARVRHVCSGERFSCREDAFRTLVEVRCADGSAAAAAAIVGGELPAVGRLAMIDTSFVIGLGPQWWMIDAPDGRAPLKSLAGVSAVDVSAQRSPFVLEGTAVRDVLAHGMALDLHPDHFPEGAAAQTLLAKAAVIVARSGPDQYRVWVRASFARYLAMWLMDASVEYR